jgi:hypothetical protein
MSMRNTTPTRVFGIVAGSLSALLAVVLLLAGGGLLWAVDSHTDDAGYFATASHRYATPTRALATEDLDVGDAVFGAHRLADITIRPDRDVFIGVADRDKAGAYLAGVSHDEITDVDYDPFKVRSTRREGARAPAAPASQDFWVATATGGKPLTWPVQKGHWAVVVMNADGSPGVEVGAKVEVKVPFLHRIALGLLIGGGALGLLGGALLTLAARSRVATPA